MKALDAQACMERARSLIRGGRLDEAQRVLDGLLEQAPTLAEAHHLKGALQYRLGLPAEAVQSFGRAIGLQPDVAAYHTNLGLALQALGQHEQALSCHQQAIALRPDYAEGYNNCGTVLYGLERWEEALATYAEALRLKPGLADALNNRGNVLARLGRHEEAAQSYADAIKAAPLSASAYFNQGVLCRRLGDLSKCLASLRQAVQLDPQHAYAWHELAQAQVEEGRLDEALIHQERALALRPNDAGLYNGLGAVRHARRQLHEAWAAFDQALRLDPRHAPAHSNKGVTLKELGRWQDALASFDAALAVQPASVDALLSRGHVLRDLGAHEQALESFTRAHALAPDHEWLEGTVVHAKAQLCDWTDWEGKVQHLLAGVAEGRCVSPPFPVLAVTDDPQLQLKVARTYVERKYGSRHAAEWAASAPDHTRRAGRLRIGYFSADFHDHATMRLMAQLFECHDRARFEVYAFSFGPHSDDAMRRRLIAAVDHFVDVRYEDDAAVVQRCREAEIDIAIDLKGHTREARFGIFGRRCAPVQISYLGYPGTSGSPALDYLVADSFLIPQESRTSYSERIIFMPGCYQVNDAKLVVPSSSLHRPAYGLPPEAFVFCCFNNSYKILPEMLDVWVRILTRVDGSVLWLLEDNPSASQKLRQAARERGLEPSRLIFAPRVPTPEHLARHRMADLFLDTFPCAAHTTASDALRAGLPVLALVGRSFASRVSGSLLGALGLDDLVTHSCEQYERTAARLALDRGHLAALRQRLARELERNSLFDARAFTSSLESALEQVHLRHLAGHPPADFVVGEGWGEPSTVSA